MTSRHYRWLIALLAMWTTAGIVAGCDQQHGWEHSNRELFAAPPEQTTNSMSIEELELLWSEQDLQDQKATDRAGSPDDPSTPSHMIGVALEHVQKALGGGPAGGGPAPNNPPLADDGTGEM
jgi:hypothetical protein